MGQSLLNAAGLPNAPEHLHRVRTYTERWRYFQLGLLTPQQTADAIRVPLEEQGITVEPHALDLLVAASAGYPYFIQRYAAAAWLLRDGTAVTERHVAEAIPGVRRQLEDTLYEARFRRLTARECAFVLASLGPGSHPSGAVARTLGRPIEAVSSIRRRLIEKDVIFAPASGMIAFRIPLSDAYIERHRAALARRAAEATT
jgi:hypothetical protein